MEEVLFLKEDPIIKNVYTISKEIGVETFLVGGTVRDLLLSKPIGRDYDFVLGLQKEGSREVIREIVKRIAAKLKGSLFPLDIEEDIYRIVVKVPLSSLPSKNYGHVRDDALQIKYPVSIDISPLKGGSIEEDLRQRDFTINSMALNLREVFQGAGTEIIDPLGGIDDLKRCLLRMSSEDIFINDPVRLLRAFRFSAVQGLRIEVKTRESIREESHRLKSSSWERIRDEFFSILETDRACHHVQSLAFLGLLKEILPGDICEGGTSNNTFATLMEMENLLNSPSDIAPLFESKLSGYFKETAGGISKGALLKFAALICDLWGLGTAVEEGGADIIDKRTLMMKNTGKRLKLSRKACTILVDSVKNLPAALNLLSSQRIKDPDIYLFFSGSGRDRISLIILSFACIKAGGEGLETGKIRVETIFRYLFEVYERFLSTPLLTGSDVMKTFGVPQGGRVGEVLRKVELARAEGIIKNKREAVEYVRNYLVKVVQTKGLTNKGCDI